MIDTCDPAIATWSDTGDSFVVKDTEKFASEIIGQFFKHNNFSSFVRQLNFYGFRKIKSDPLRIRDAAADIESKYWKFKHEKFQRGRPDLLAEIRKSNHNETAEKHEVDNLRGEIKNLKSRLASMNKEMEKMASLVATVMQNQQVQQTQEPAAKKRKVTASPVPMSVPSDVLGKNGALDLEALDDLSVDLDSLVPPKVAPAPLRSREQSVSSFTSTDEQILSSLFALESTDDINVVSENEPSLKNFRLPEKLASKSGSRQGPNQPDPVLMTKLSNALSVLPKNLQELFVDRIVTFVVDPDSFKKQVDAVSNLAMAAAAEAQNRAGQNADPNQTNTLASAVMGAWLSRFGSGTEPKTVGIGPSAGTVSDMVPLDSVPLDSVPAPAVSAPAPSRMFGSDPVQEQPATFFPPLEVL
jgi:hypothetical protein